MMKIILQNRNIVDILLKNNEIKTFEVIDVEDVFTRFGHKLILNLKSKDICFDWKDIINWRFRDLK